MKHIFVRLAKPEESQTYESYARATADNLFDPDVALYPSTLTWVAYDEKGPLVFDPVQRPYMMDALAIRPGAGEVDVAVALKELTQNLITQAHLNGVGEILFNCKDESTIKFAKHQGFEELPWRLFRVKISDLEKEKE